MITQRPAPPPPKRKPRQYYRKTHEKQKSPPPAPRAPPHTKTTASPKYHASHRGQGPETQSQPSRENTLPENMRESPPKRQKAVVGQ